MFGISGFELLIILIFGFILLGDRLPDAARALGRALRTFKTAKGEMNEVINKDFFDPNAEEPFKDPLNAINKMGDVAKRAGTSLAEDFSEVKATAKKAKGTAASNVSPAAAAAAAQVVSKIEGTAPAAESTAEAAEAEPATSSAARPVGKPIAQVGEKPAESFTERRARYERERAARLAAEAEAKAAAEREAEAEAEAVEAAPASEEPGEGE